MVFFTCNGCGESLKKAQVDKHVNMCRGCQVLSCIDCGQDFWGDDYKNHVKCISEDQKYGGKGYEAKANKGDVKQQQWLQRIHDAMNKPGVNPKLKDVLKQVSAYDNVPRKKNKFENWMKNSLRISSSYLHEEVWKILNTANENPPEVSQTTAKDQQPVAEVKADTNGQEAKAAKKKKKDGKRKQDLVEDCADDEPPIKKSSNEQATEADDIEESQGTAALKGKFNWKGTIKALLREAPDQEMPLKKLKRKIVAAYFECGGDGRCVTKEEVIALFSKKISKNPKFTVLNERVKLKMQC